MSHFSFATLETFWLTPRTLVTFCFDTKDNDFHFALLVYIVWEKSFISIDKSESWEIVKRSWFFSIYYLCTKSALVAFQLPVKVSIAHYSIMLNYRRLLNITFNFQGCLYYPKNCLSELFPAFCHTRLNLSSFSAVECS